MMALNTTITSCVIGLSNVSTASNNGDRASIRIIRTSVTSSMMGHAASRISKTRVMRTSKTGPTTWNSRSRICPSLCNTFPTSGPNLEPSMANVSRIGCIAGTRLVNAVARLPRMSVATPPNVVPIAVRTGVRVCTTSLMPLMTSVSGPLMLSKMSIAMVSSVD